MIEYSGLFVLLAYSVNMWAMLSVWASGARLTSRALWSLALLVPILGFVAWYILGPRRTVP